MVFGEARHFLSYLKVHNKDQHLSLGERRELVLALQPALVFWYSFKMVFFFPLGCQFILVSIIDSDVASSSIV